jgi:hypothetical protein
MAGARPQNENHWTFHAGTVSDDLSSGKKKAPFPGLHLFDLFVNPCLKVRNRCRVLLWISPVMSGGPVLDGRPALAATALVCRWPLSDSKPLVGEISIQRKFCLFFGCHGRIVSHNGCFVKCRR